VTIDVFQASSGRRVIGERRVARFAARSRSVSWDGRAASGPRVRDGYFLVRFTMTLPGGRSDVRRVTIRRVRGRFVARPGSHRRASCGPLRAFKLERPVFGGTNNRALGISFRLRERSTVTVTVLRGRRVVRRYAASVRAASRTHRLRLAPERLAPGDHRIRIEVRRGSRRVVSTLTARRL
jgi:hypothetical protein